MNYKFHNYLSKVASTTDVGNGAYDIGSGTTDRFNNIWAITFNGTSTQSQYADLAEKYICGEKDISKGTVMSMSSIDGVDVEICYEENSALVVGVISEKPGNLMNSDCKDGQAVGLVGKLPVRIIGPIRKSDPIVSSGNGCARAMYSPAELIYKIGYATETNMNSGEKLVECIIK